jgi:DNA polymerase elongation subunit (family B)
MSALIFDIETIGEDFNSLDEITQEVLTRWIKKESGNREEYEKSLEDLKNRLGFSPLTGEIVAIGILDSNQDKGAVYFQSPGDPPTGGKIEMEENGIKLKSMTEKEMLENFWKVCTRYKEFVSFNGQSFDVPYLMTRSAIHKVRPCKNLMSNRYLGSQKPDSKHIDLLDQLSFYGAVRRKPNLHLCCRAFGIKSPKAEGITGDDVGKLFREKKFLDIAKYNAGDLTSTRELYKYWKNYLNL